jgi:hypothetical protein
MSASPVRVLSASVDPALNQARALLLQTHGFQVVTSESDQRSREQLESFTFDVLIFGSTLGRDACWQLAEVFRRRNSRGRIIEIIPAPLAPPKNQPDATVVRADEPNKLIPTIFDTLRQKARHDEEWMRLCRQAVIEKDPAKFTKLIDQLLRVFRERDEKEKP